MYYRDRYLREIGLMESLGQLLSAYEELAVMRIGEVRRQVVATRTFREGLFQIFSEILSSQRRELAQLRKGRERGGLLRFRIPGRRQADARPTTAAERQVVVLLSSNQRLSGDITRRVFRKFLAHLSAKQPSAVVVVGSVGKEYVEQARPDLTFTYFDLPREDAGLSDYKRLVSFLRDFDAVTIFYGKFVNVVDQLAAMARLTSVARLPEYQLAQEPVQPVPVGPPLYLFEPELPAVLEFFDTQIFALLFRQTTSEGALALMGSRITAMESATANVEDRLRQLSLQERLARRAERNRKQRQLLAGMSLWGM